MKITPFSINIPELDLQNMRSRLRATRWADDFGNSDWRFGVEKSWLQDMVSYWTDGYDWRAEETLMNSLPHYKVELNGIVVHFLHIRGKGPNPTPLILTHGWPWTFWDWHGVIGPLTDPAAHGADPADSFDLVIPSIPGFGFSMPFSTPGIGIPQTAALWVRLMQDVLGYSKFAAAGGDFGGLVTSELGFSYGEHLLGIYLTMPMLHGVNSSKIKRTDYAPDEAWMPDQVVEAAPTIRSHVTVHSSDPQTLAYALSDSPVGTAAWIWERRRAWSDCGGDAVGLHGRDFLCTLASLYWLTNTIGTSIRIYPEIFGSRAQQINHSDHYISVPTGFGIAPKDVAMMPRAVAERFTNLQSWTIFPKGGHFSPSEQPDQVARAFRAFFCSVR